MQPRSYVLSTYFQTSTVIVVFKKYTLVSFIGHMDFF